MDGAGFLSGYEALLVEYGQDYRAIRYKHEGTEAIGVLRWYRADGHRVPTRV
jgi:hypothetical protein